MKERVPKESQWYNGRQKKKGQEHRWEAGEENEDRAWREFGLAGCCLLRTVQPKVMVYRGWEGTLVLHNQM